MLPAMLPPGRGDIPAFTPDEALATPEGCKAELTIKTLYTGTDKFEG